MSIQSVKRKPQIVLYEDTALYEMEKDGVDHLFSLELGGDQPVLLGKGKILVLYGSVLLAKNDTHYMAVDVSQRSDWVTLESLKTETVHLQYGDKALLFSYDADGSYVDVVDLAALTAIRRKIETTVYTAIAEGEPFY